MGAFSSVQTVEDNDYFYGNMSITDRQRSVLVTLERVGAALSIVSVLAVFAAFAWTKRLRTVPNTFIAFASIANVGAGIACFIGNQGLTAGAAGSLCQAQAFLLEMFMQSDPWWSFAMAVNVFLVFFCAANPNSFMKYLWLYCLICYGGPGLAATLCAALKGGEIYGDATLWCWIEGQYNSVRIWSYYMPIWFCIIFSIIIYIAIGYHVFHQRNMLRNLTLSNPAKDELSCATEERDPCEKQRSEHSREYYGTIITEIQVTTSSPYPPPPTPPPRTPPAAISTPSRGDDWPTPDFLPHPADPHDPELGGAPSAGPFQSYSSVSSDNKKAPRRSIKVRMHDLYARCVSKLTKMDPVKMAYLRTSVVFGFSVLVTWTPSSILRVYDLVYDNKFNFPLNCAAAVVLPLQGVWNAFIFFTTSWKVVREEWATLKAGWSPRRFDSIVRRRWEASRVSSEGRIDKRAVRIRPVGCGSSEVELTGMECQLPVPARSANTIRAMRGSF